MCEYLNTLRTVFLTLDNLLHFSFEIQSRVFAVVGEYGGSLEPRGKRAREGILCVWVRVRELVEITFSVIDVAPFR